MHNRLATYGVIAKVVMASARQGVRGNPSDKTFIESNREPDTVKFYDFESKTLKMCYKNVAQSPDDNPYL